MQRQNRVGIEGLVPKVRKRGFSSSSSASSFVHSYRFKRAIVVGRSRSNTPAPPWRTTPSIRTAAESPAGTSRPVSARNLAATLWEINEVTQLEQRRKKKMVKEEKIRAGYSGSGSGPMPSHLCDPSHSPVSEMMDRSGTGSYQKRMPSSSHRMRPIEHNVGVLDSLSSASLVEMETRSQASVYVVGVKTRLKDVSNALTTSKELLKIINWIWAHADPPSSSTSLVSALHAELERARLQVNQLIQEQRSDQNEINYLMKCFAEEKASWKNKERKAMESIANELEVERKLRKRSDSLNKKLGKELSETKASFLKALKMLENEKRVRERIEQNGDDRKHHSKEKNSAVNELRKQLDTILGTKNPKFQGNGSQNLNIGDKIAAYLSETHSNSFQNDENEDDVGELVVDCGEDSAGSDLHSIELNTDNNHKNYYKWSYPSGIGRESNRVLVDEIKARNFRYGTHNGKKYDYADEIQRLQAVAGLKDHLLASARKSSGKDVSSPSRQWDPQWLSRDPCGTISERSSVTHHGDSYPPKSRLADSKGEGQNARRSKW